MLSKEGKDLSVHDFGAGVWGRRWTAKLYHTGPCCILYLL
jgi:hypothetical protein